MRDRLTQGKKYTHQAYSLLQCRKARQRCLRRDIRELRHAMCMIQQPTYIVRGAPVAQTLDML